MEQVIIKALDLALTLTDQEMGEKDRWNAEQYRTQFFVTYAAIIKAIRENPIVDKAPVEDHLLLE